MFRYCFEFKSTVALGDQEITDISNAIRANSPVCGGIQVDEFPGVEADKKPVAPVDNVCGD